ncbi:MAG: 2-hydroxychromene-2-carboxylate isomerase [Lautropia sp.]
MKTVTCYMHPASPWAYLGHERFAAIAARHAATIELCPIDLGGRVFPVSGGLPLPKRSPQRRAYRLVELRRWSAWLGVPLKPEPAHFPVDGTDASRVIALAGRDAGAGAAMRLAGLVMKGVWADELDIADHATLRAMIDACGLDGRALLDARHEADPLIDEYTTRALADQVFGVPWYVHAGEPFWGQDRLDFLDRALAT